MSRQSSDPDLVRAIEAHRAGKLSEAKQGYRRVLRRNPSSSAALNALAVLALMDKEHAHAETLLRRALASNPKSRDAHVNLGVLLTDVGRLEEALGHLQQASQLGPEDARIHLAIGHALYGLRRHGEAARAYRAAYRCNPDDDAAFVSSVMTKRAICDWTDFEDDEIRVRRLATSGSDVPPFLLLSLGSTPEEQLVCATHRARQIEVPAGAQLRHAPCQAKRPEAGRIRLGYLSGDFHDHATSYLVAELLERHDRARFEVFGYSYGPPRASETRRRIEQAFDAFAEIRELPPQAAARRIAQDSVDILLDLKGYTQGVRPEILAYRPAPIQVNYLGFPGTMGARFVDYVIADSFVAPQEFQPYCTERIVHLPDCFQPNDTKRPTGDLPVSRAECGLGPGFVFCCFNNPYKLGPKMFDIWMRLLRAVPDSVLWLLARSPEIRGNLQREAAARGVAPERLVFSPHLPRAEYLARYRLADLFLDTLPVSAFTTASDALWVGLPVLTCAGATPAGRGAGSLLRSIGVPELITHALEDYQALALRLAQDRGGLARLRSKLADNRDTSPLFDIARFVRNLEAAFVHMHETCVAGAKPEPFAVSAAAAAAP